MREGGEREEIYLFREEWKIESRGKRRKTMLYDVLGVRIKVIY